jgi:transposase
MFIDLNEINDVYLYVDHIDFRKGVYGICSCIDFEFSGAGGEKNLFIFSNRRRNKARVLYWDDTGYALWHKALEKDKFRWPMRGESAITITVDQLKSLLRGLSIETHKKIEAKSFF